MRKIISLIAFIMVMGLGAHLNSAMGAEQKFDVDQAIAAGDHKGLAEYYRAQAEDYRKKAAAHDTMHTDYKKSHVHYKGMENTFQAHCSQLKEKALETAAKYDQMAQDEEKLVKGK
ncbi:MAG TPA: hypothetical protein VJR29_09060 [bacterium]|nr:hypothetical protein [bacterium]